MNNILAYIGSVLIVVLAAIFAVPAAVDWNSYRGVFEEEASRMLGREVRVQGNVSLRLLPTPYVQAERLRIGGAVGEETGRPLFRAERFTMWLSIPPLLKGVVEARDVEIVKPVLELTVDAEGVTSLASLKGSPGRLSFVPQDIAFRSVNVIDGSLGLTGPKGTELARIDGLYGEVSADTIEGPFRYRGTLVWEGGLREVRLNTAARDPNGDLRFKALVTVPSNSNYYSLDGTARNITGKAAIDGTLTARISTQGFEVSPEPGADAIAAVPAPATAKTAAFFEMTAKLASAPGRVDLDDISIALQQNGLPQLISGRSSLAWSDQVKLDMQLTSKWLDLDQLSTGASGTNSAIPLELARTLFDRLVDELPATVDTAIAISVDQVGLGQQSVSGLKLEASRSGGPLELKNVRASLPGGTNLALDGVLDGADRTRSFTGTMALSGQSLTRFTTWGFGDNPFSRSRSDGPFAISGNLRLDDSAIELTDASAEVSGTPIIGEVKLGLAEPRRLSVALDGDKINLDDLWPGNPGLRGLRGLLIGGAPSAASEADNVFGGIFGSDVAFEIKAGQLIDGARKLENVHLDVALQKGALTVPKLKFLSKGGLAVDLEGSASDVPDKTRGSLRGVIEAPTPDAVLALSDLFDLPPDIETKLSRWSGLTPWRVATTFSFGQRQEAAVDVTVDGTLRGGRIVAEARIDAARGDWRTAPADIMAQIDTADVYGFLDQMSGSSSNKSEARPGKVFVKAAGKAADGLVAVAELSAETVDLEFNGRVRVPEAGHLTAKGDIRVAAQDLGRVMNLAGLSIGAGAGSVPVAGTLAAAHDGTKLTIASPALKIGDASVSGVLTYTGVADGKPAVVEADLSADKASLPGLLSALSAAPIADVQPVVELPALSTRRRRADAEIDVSLAPPAKIWPDQSFNFSPLDGVTGTIKASLRALSLESRLAMKDARFEIAFEPGKLDVRRLEGAVLGGKAEAAFTVQKQLAGASLAGNLDILISSKGQAESGADEAIEGDVASLAVGFEGRALSLAGMVTAMTGKGSLSLGDVTLSGVAPKAVADVADQALQTKGLNSGEPLQNAVRAALKTTRLKLGKVTVPVSIADGVMRLDQVQVETAEGRATFDTFLDLQTLALDSSWQIEAKALTRAQPSVSGAATVGAAAAGVPAPVAVSRTLLPPVAIVYAGPLADLETLVPGIATDALERELTVRRMERDVDELERLRRIDEDRARKERERQQALDAERQRQQKERDVAPASGAAAPQSAAPAPVPVDGAASIDPNAAAESAAANPLPEAVDDAAPERPRVQAAPKKKPPKSGWEPFQISPYQ